MSDEFVFTSENLIENIHKLGAWSSYGLAEMALKHYFPNEFDEDGNCDIDREIELMGKLGCDTWHDAIIKYQKEVGYDAPDGFNPKAVNQY